MPSEFGLIRQYFTRPSAESGVLLGVGDDAALLSPPAGEVLAATVDTLVAGRHFPEATPPAAIAHKALAVNLSDLAAMGATPRWFLLALTLPEATDAFLSEFAAALFALADAAGIALVGGDTTRGPLAISITALGSVPPALALRRSGARPGDGIYVSGTVGDAGLGLREALTPGETGLSAEQAAHVRRRLDYPQPRLALGTALRGTATACLDISDGLAQDLGHILTASGVGAALDLEALPLSPALRALPEREAWRLALTAGDDYELCFTLPDGLTPPVSPDGLAVTRIGTITAAPGLVLRCRGERVDEELSGYRHF
jgi:thiamine-monophosphate kinase